MEKLRIKFHPLFFLYVFICVYFGWFNQIFYYVITVALHEFGHYIVLKHFGYDMSILQFSLSGAGLKGNNQFKEKHEILISLAGPFVNLILIILTVAFWWILPTSYLFTRDFFYANIFVMLFNLMPLYPLDGGRILTSILVIKKHSRDKILKVNRIVCFFVGIILILLFFVSLFYSINYNLLFMSFFMFMNSFGHNNSKFYERINSINKKQDKLIEVKVFKINSEDKLKMLKNLSPHYYSIFEVGEGNNKKIIEEKDLINY